MGRPSANGVKKSRERLREGSLPLGLGGSTLGKLAWIKSGRFGRRDGDGDGGGETLNDVDVIDLHAKIEMKGTTGSIEGGRARIGEGEGEGPLGIDNCATHKKRAGKGEGGADCI